MDPKGSNLASTDLLEISQLVSGSYVTKSITGAEIISGATTGFVPTSRTLTINGTTQDLSADRTFTVSTGITIGTTAITSGTVGRVLFEGTGNVVQESANLFFDATNNRLGINTSTPTNPLSVYRSGSTNFFNLEPSATGTAPFIQGFFAGAIDARIYFDNVLKLRSGGSTTVYGLDCGNIAANGNIIVSGGTEHKIQLGGSTNNYIQYTDAGAINIGVIGTADATSYIQVRTGNATNMSTGTMSTAFFNTGNIGINTTTDAGFKLDVNGTARFVNDVSFNGSAKFGDGTARITGAQIGGQGANNGVNTLINNGADWVDDTNVSALAIRYNQGVRIPNTTRYPLTIGSNAKATASAQIEMVSTTQGFLPPRMTTTQKNAIATPATGLMVYDNLLNRPCFYDGATWITL